MNSVDLFKLEARLAEAEEALDDERFSGSQLSSFHAELRHLLQTVTAERIKAEYKELEAAEQNGALRIAPIRSSALPRLDR